MRLDFRHLEILVAVEDTGDKAAAGRRLGLTAQNLGRQLARIEEHLGHVVFEMQGERLVPTAAGLDDLTIARQALRAVEGIGPADRPTSMRLLYYRTPLPGIVQGLRDAHPHLSVSLEVASPVDGHRQVANGSADAFVGCLLPHVHWPSHPEVAETHVLSDPTRVLLPRGHRSAGAELIDLADLAGEDWVTEPDADARDSIVAECRIVGGFDAKIVYEVVDLLQMRSLVADGLGVAFVSSATPPDDGYVTAAYAGATPSQVTIAHARDRIRSEVVGTISDLLRARFARPGAG